MPNLPVISFVTPPSLTFSNRWKIVTSEMCKMTANSGDKSCKPFPHDCREICQLSGRTSRNAGSCVHLLCEMEACELATAEEQW
jgi:hypothetical protein